MATKAAALELVRDGAARDLDEICRQVSDAAGELASDPKWSGLADSLRRTADRGSCLADSLQTSHVACDLEGIVDCACLFAGDVLRALHIPGIEFYRDIESGIRLRGATGCWERVLLKLLINAGEAMKQGGIVEVHACRQGDRIEITVADSGPGVPVEALPHLFKPSFSTRNKGAGVGLNLVETIVRRNGGTIAASNRAGASGAEFRISVPA